MLALPIGSAIRSQSRLFGERIADAEDAAILFQPFRNPNHEHLVMMGVNAEGEVVRILPMTAQNGYAVQPPSNYEIQRILANNPDIKGFWLVHNHPETISSMGGLDLDGEARIKTRFGNLFKGMVATDTGEYSAVVDGLVYDRQEFNKPIDDIYLQRPENVGVLGLDVPQGEATPTNYADPAYIAGIAREAEADVSSAPDLVTFVVVKPETLEAGGSAHMIVTATETHKDLHSLSPEALHERIHEINTRNGAYHTYVVVSNPSDAALYGEGSAWHHTLSQNDVVSGIFIDTPDTNFPFRKQTFERQGTVAQGLGTRGRSGRVQLDESGELIDPRETTQLY